MNFYTLREAAAAITAEMHPGNEKNQTEAMRCYVAALENAVGTNGIVYRDPVTRLPLQRVGIAASLAAHSCVVSQLDLNAWIGAQGIGIQVEGSPGARVGRNPARADESPEARRARLSARKQELIASGVRAFNKRLSEEEGVTVGRIQQDLRERSSVESAPFPFRSRIVRRN